MMDPHEEHFGDLSDRVKRGPVIDYAVEPERAQQPIEGEPFHRYTFDDGTVWTEFFRTGCGYLLRFPELADFEVSPAGDAVVAHPAPGTDEATVEHLYINQMVPLALSRQGRPAFHASVVTIPGGAVAFLGKTGMGKSTLAASFASAGSEFLTDDALIIDEVEGIHALPSHASVRLWEDSVDALIPKDVPTAAEVSYTSKTRLLANDALRYNDTPAPLLAAYVLDWQDVDAVVIEPLRGSERPIAWIGNSFLLDIEDRDLLARHFEWTNRIAGQVPTFSLDYPRIYGLLPQVRDAVRRHTKTLGN
jgi:hypothetical protein